MDEKSDRLEFWGGTLGAFMPLITLIGVIVLMVLFEWIHTKTLSAACLAALFVAIVLAKKPSDAADAQLVGMARKMVAVMAMAWILASIMGKLMQASGLVDSLVWLADKMSVSAGLIPLVSFLLAAVFSTATGTSGGSVAAIAPLLFPVGVGIGADPLVMIGAVVSGAFFGDNIAPISDTTIASAFTQGARVQTVVRSRLKYAFVAGGFSAVMFIIFGFSTASESAASSFAEGMSGKGLIMIVIPAMLIVLMYRGVHLITALIVSNGAGIALALATDLMDVRGVLFADTSEKVFSGVVYNGINGMLPIIIFTMLLLGLVGIFEKAGLFQLILDKISRFTENVRDAELSIFGVTIVGNLITAGSARSIVAIGPIAKEMGDAHDLAPKRNANIMDAVATGSIMFVPYNPVVLLATGLAASSEIVPPDFGIVEAMPYFFHGMALLAVMLFAVLTGWGRTYKDEESRREEEEILGINA